jgi:hypothetical protein
MAANSSSYARFFKKGTERQISAQTPHTNESGWSVHFAQLGQSVSRTHMLGTSWCEFPSHHKVAGNISRSYRLR